MNPEDRWLLDERGPSMVCTICWTSVWANTSEGLARVEMEHEAKCPESKISAEKIGDQ